MYLQPGFYVVIEQLEGPHAPRPLPLDSGFSKHKAYLAIGAFSMSESAEMFFILSNDRNETWLISNRHVRTLKVVEGATQLRIDLNPNVAHPPLPAFFGSPTRPIELPTAAAR